MEAMPVTDTLELIAYDTTEERAEAVERDGFAYMPAVLDADEVAELREHIAALEPNPDAFDRRNDIDKHIKTTFNRDPYFVRFLDMEPAASLAERVMGEDCHVIGMTGWMTGPNRPDQDLHVDYLAAGDSRRPAPRRQGQDARFHRHGALLPQRPLRGAGADQVHPREATSPDASLRRKTRPGGEPKKRA